MFDHLEKIELMCKLHHQIWSNTANANFRDLIITALTRDEEMENEE